MIRILIGGAFIVAAFALVVLARAIASEKIERDHEERMRRRYLGH